jgi:1-acyl-sn-glycerol-3-phosphate acyltransferase
MTSRQVPTWRPRPRWTFVVIATVVRPLLVVLTRRRWVGTSNVPRSGGVIIAVNHISYVDPLVVGHLLYNAGRVPLFMGKQEMFRWPVVGPVMRLTGQIPVNRNSPDASLSLRHAVTALQGGECVVIYPEGTVTREPDYWPMAGRTGVARLALLSGAPVIPVAQWGAHRILGRDRRPRLLPRRTISLLVGPPVDLGAEGEEGISMDALQAATRRVMTAITGQLAQLRGEPAPEPVDPPTVGSA